MNRQCLIIKVYRFTYALSNISFIQTISTTNSSRCPFKSCEKDYAFRSNEGETFYLMNIFPEAELRWRFERITSDYTTDTAAARKRNEFHLKWKHFLVVSHEPMLNCNYLQLKTNWDFTFQRTSTFFIFLA